MNEGSWIFAQGEQRLTLERQPTEGGYLFTITRSDGPKSYFFSELEQLAQFQADMEEFLLNTGWSFESFSPDHRAGGDRRGWPRRANDRRRWWTDLRQ